MKDRTNMKKSVVPEWTQEKKGLPKNPNEYDRELPTLPESIIDQPNNPFYEQSGKLVGTPGSAFTFDKNRILAQIAPID